ncbi:EF hand [Nitrosospira multiformis]|uniref:EF hand n=1 Tax=Nitrosospira multiformis TaxID=1231 RepID=A0A1H8JAU4_9PROT|nr:EF-hand domain-containing protein [Nitrosospira multiformis]SEN78023.1 EF hand [Nitrosospira multiformis]
MKNRYISGSLSIPLIIVAFGLPTPVLAEVSPERKPDARGVITPPWELYDADEDGYITMKEAAVQKMSPQVFHSLDIDRDGRLNRNEFTKAPPIREK